MEIFKIDVLKKEFERFQKEDLVKVLKCGHCQKTACGYWHKSIFPRCKYCRETFCKTCHKFNIAKNILLENADSTAKDYIENFIQDFLCISNETLETSENDFEVVERIPIKKSQTVKSYHKSEKNRSQIINKKLVDCEKISYTMKGKSKTFYKKF